MIGAGLLARDMLGRGRDGRHRSPAVGMTEPVGSSPEPSGPARPRGADGRLVVCPTPIGNLEDVTLRVLAALREADVVACEDTRHTRVLLERYGVSAKLVSYHEHNERARAAELVEQMREGAVVALVSDAGMPLVSDPGLPARPGLRRRGARRRGAARPVERPDRAGGQRAPVRRLALRGLPAAQARRAGGRVRDTGDAGRLRVSAPDRRVAGGARRTRPGPPGRRLPRADQAARGGRARQRGRTGRQVRGRGGARRDRRRGRRRPRTHRPRPGRGRGRAHARRVRRARQDRGEGRGRAHRRPGQRPLPRSART